jgi:hypothetical protein
VADGSLEPATGASSFSMRAVKEKALFGTALGCGVDFNRRVARSGVSSSADEREQSADYKRTGLEAQVLVSATSSPTGRPRPR